MTLKPYLWGIRIFTLAFVVTFGVVVVYLNPELPGITNKVIFYASLFLLLVGWFNLFLLFIRRKTLGEENTLANIGLSFRQAVLLAILFIGLLILQSQRMLVWWDGLLLVAGIFLVELFFLSRN